MAIVVDEQHEDAVSGLKLTALCLYGVECQKGGSSAVMF